MVCAVRFIPLPWRVHLPISCNRFAGLLPRSSCGRSACAAYPAPRLSPRHIMAMYGHCSCPINGKRASRTRGCEFSRQAPESHQEWIGRALPGGHPHNRELAVLGRYSRGHSVGSFLRRGAGYTKASRHMAWQLRRFPDEAEIPGGESGIDQGHQDKRKPADARAIAGGRLDAFRKRTRRLKESRITESQGITIEPCPGSV